MNYIIKLKSIIIIFFCLLTFSCEEQEQEKTEFIFNKNGLNLISEIDSPVFLEHNGIYYGYMYDILRDYAKQKEIIFYVTLASNSNQIVDSLVKGVADLGLCATIFDNKKIDEQVMKIDVSICDTYVIMSKKYHTNLSENNIAEKLKGKKVAVTNSVRSTSFFETYSNKSFGVDFIIDTTKENSDIAKKLAFGEADYLICTKTTSLLLNYRFKNFKTVYNIDEQSCFSFYVAKKNKDLYENFNEWYLKEYVNSEAEKYNKNMYNSNQFINEFIKNGYIVSYNAASPFDYVFKQVGKQFNINWMILCSIAHFESRYNPFIKSNKGATGIMQIMPHIARRYGFNVDSLTVIDYNISVAGYMLKDIRRMLKYDNDVLNNDELSIMLACYNGGIGHINDARRLARSRGENTNVWINIENSLRDLSEESIYNNKELVKHGKFNAGQTIHYVNSVMEMYENLKQKIK